MSSEIKVASRLLTGFCSVLKQVTGKLSVKVKEFLAPAMEAIRPPADKDGKPGELTETHYRAIRAQFLLAAQNAGYKADDDSYARRLLDDAARDLKYLHDRPATVHHKFGVGDVEPFAAEIAVGAYDRITGPGVKGKDADDVARQAAKAILLIAGKGGTRAYSALKGKIARKPQPQPQPRKSKVVEMPAPARDNGQAVAAAA